MNFMQAPFLPLEDTAAGTEASPVTATVGDCVDRLTRDCGEPELLLESIATTLSSSDYSSPQAAMRQVKAADIAIRAIPSVRLLLRSKLCPLGTF
jgi:hypothetical protein